MRYINAIVKVLSFHGGFLRGFWEQVMCKIYGVPVENKKYFQLNEMAGHVEHEPLPTAEKSFWFCVIPGLMMFLTGLIFAVPSFIAVLYLDTASALLLPLFLGYIGSVFVYSTNLFPSVEDALMMWEKFKTLSKVKKFFYAPGAAIMYVGAYAESWGITFVTNAALSGVIVLPYYIDMIKAMA